MSESSADAMMKHLRAITKGPIPLGKILKDVDPSAVYTISSRHRELDIMGAINFAKAPGISNEDLLAKNVTELAIPFGMAVTTFVTEVSCFIVFVRRDRVIAIGFSGSQTIPSFREWVAK